MPFGQLIETVEQLLEEHEAFLQVAEEKKRALIKGDIEKLQQIVNQEVQFIRRVEKLEEERIRQGRLIAEQFGLPIEELTASKLVQLDLDKERAAKFNLLTGKFVKIMGDLRMANELNGQLIRQSLELVEHTIDLMTEMPDSGTYSGNGDSGQAVAGPRRFFDTQV
ncbi:flagellar protein FlgN [Effusibacillus lacus]|uniref:Flagellar biosynthesis protein FlgN n=1 Tax=Effusibacillus lacus TaxID=1348429 RepID=A0A292YKJ2_9BACL|nr:flagellar protein FlgN [Effusibacillus lacus]TCS69812.1 flagellar biosynthesis/type III secretory pathway chaperone [Effusibacillus lacus]GAX88894.1 flagellar biosynthesis protein FlgN [Effusibacillus lacus]